MFKIRISINSVTSSENKKTAFLLRCTSTLAAKVKKIYLSAKFMQFLLL